MDADSAAEEGAAGVADSLGPSGKLLLAASAFSGLAASLAGIMTSGAATAAALSSSGAALGAAALAGAGT